MVAPINLASLKTGTGAVLAVEKKVAEKMAGGVVGKVATAPVANGGNILGTSMGIASKVQNVSFFSSLGAMVIGGLGTFTGINALKSFARRINVGAHLSDYTFRDVGDKLGAIKVGVPAGVNSMVGSVQETVSSLQQNATQAVSGKGFDFSFGFLDKWALKRGARNALTSTNVHEGLKENIGKYIDNIEKLSGVDDATRNELLTKAAKIKDSLHNGYESVIKPEIYQSVRNDMRGLENQLHKIADQSQTAGYKQMGASIGNGASSLKNKLGNLFTKDGFTSIFKRNPATQIESGAAAAPTASGLAAHARSMRSETRLMAETSNAAGPDMTFGKWVGARSKVLPDITLQQGVMGAVQFGAFAMASKRAVSESKTAIGNLKAQHEDLTGQKISTMKLLFSSKIPETLKASRAHSLGKTAPSIIGNFALFATTLFFQRRMGFAQIMGLQIGGGLLLNGIMKKDFAGNHYAEMKAKFAAGEPLTAQHYVDQLAAMNDKTAKSGKIGDVDASSVAYYCAFNQVDPAAVLRMIEASHKDKLAAQAWADEAKATIAAHNETKAKAPENAVEQTAILGQQAADYVKANDRTARAVLGQHTAKVVKDTRAQASGAVLA